MLRKFHYVVNQIFRSCSLLCIKYTILDFSSRNNKKNLLLKKGINTYEGSKVVFIRLVSESNKKHCRIGFHINYMSVICLYSVIDIILTIDSFR